ncbi:MAG: Exonuclease SbcC [Ktedonobacterales bacterium]|nr:MAG: Exonuclease SbcC [Ktedonobacterales bacterium]
MDDRTRKRLEQFVEKADKLRNLSFAKRIVEQGGVEYSVRMSMDEGVYAHHTGPDPEAIIAAGATFRQFFLKKELVSFSAMSALLISPDISETWKSEFRDVNQTVDFLFDEPIPVIVDGKAYTHREVADVFFYGEIIHSDEAKARIYQVWHADPVLFSLMEFYLITTVTEVMKAIFYLADLCRRELATPSEVK